MLNAFIIYSYRAAKGSQQFTDSLFVKMAFIVRKF